MGYCPYMCRLCGTIEDNGWGNFWDELSYLLKSKGYEFVELREDDDGYAVTSDFCYRCLRIALKKASDLPKNAFDEFAYPSSDEEN